LGLKGFVVVVVVVVLSLSTLPEILFCVLLCSITKKHYQCGIEMIRRDLLTGHWKPYLQRAITLQPCYDGPINGGEVIPPYAQA